MLREYLSLEKQRVAQEIEWKIGVPGNQDITHYRLEVREWIKLHGVPKSIVVKMSDNTLWKCYNIEKYFRAVVKNARNEDDLLDSIGEPNPQGVHDENMKTPPSESEGRHTSEENPHFSELLKRWAKHEDQLSKHQNHLNTLDSFAENSNELICKLDDQVQDLSRQLRERSNIVVEIHNDHQVKTLDLGRQHKLFPRLLARVNTRLDDGSRLNIWLAGPAGSGKTMAARKAAEALGLPFYFNGAIDNEYKLLGFTDAQGRIVSRPFRECFINGGVYLFDEVDASLPPALLAFNAATSTALCDFPDGCFPRHKDCVIIAAGNTMGDGGDTKYVGRYKQDKAFADRFAFLRWEYDETFERDLARNQPWVEHVIKLRKQAQAIGLEVVISPRASIFGSAILGAGGTWEEAEEETLKKGMSQDQWNALTGSAK